MTEYKYDYPEKLRDKIDHAKIEGWKLYDQRENKVVLVRRRRASFVWHVVYAVFTLGIGNVLYWLKCRYGDAEYLTLEA